MGCSALPVELLGHSAVSLLFSSLYLMVMPEDDRNWDDSFYSMNTLKVIDSIVFFM